MKSGEPVKKTTLGGSVRGASHIAQDKPCQDAILLNESPDGRYVIACVADGHGSSHCPFSDKGAAAAADVARGMLKLILDSAKNGEDALKTFNAQREIHLPRQLETLWKKRVEEIYANGFSENAEKIIPPAFSHELYGTTLLAIAVADEFIFALQIGDGDMLMADPDGEVKRIFPPVEQAGSETYSLCMDSSWQYVQTRLIRMPAKKPLLFLLSTDGYANSFTESAGFLKAGADFYSLWREKGPDFIRENIEDWLTRSGEMGSGDDITLALVAVEEAENNA